MRRIYKNFLFALLALVLIVACAKKKTISPLSEWMQDSGKVKVLSTTAQIGDLVTYIGGDRVQSWVLVPSELDPHSYDLVKGDGEKLARADLIFFNGLGLEHGASLSSYCKASDKAVAIGEVIQRESPKEIFEKNGVVDPHVWMDVSLWKRGCLPIAEKLSKIDPEGSDVYHARAALLEEEMEKVDTYIRNLLQGVPKEKRFLVTCHDAFRYFVRSYLAENGELEWSSRFTAPEGLAPDGQISPVDIRRTVEFLKKHQIRVVFPESNVSRDVVAKVASACKEMGFEVSLCQRPLYGDSTGKLTYLEMMRQNGEVISQELRSQE
jgi:manganese/zinc/iron transport system substrate-binding protein